MDVLSYRVHRGKRLIVHYRVTNRSNKPWDFSPTQFLAFQDGRDLEQSRPDAHDMRGWGRTVTLLPEADMTLNQMFFLRDGSPVTVVPNPWESMGSESFSCLWTPEIPVGRGRSGFWRVV